VKRLFIKINVDLS